MPYLVDIHAILRKETQNINLLVYHAVTCSIYNLLGLSTRTGLPDNKREMINQATINNLIKWSIFWLIQVLYINLLRQQPFG